ncbi:hypothetical protein GARC_0650 [Paraglaciecola arctica BSs20135]|uniref:Uncharacterized protein n=1 Tax=Paraglaciecola arctica BSs20135 TaxID=493475 RepID=K6Y127_9ALTE|nr:hypothetical protein GARC_0650 [Paraglaciecola arctica BSs20135]
MLPQLNQTIKKIKTQENYKQYLIVMGLDYKFTELLYSSYPHLLLF